MEEDKALDLKACIARLMNQLPSGSIFHSNISCMKIEDRSLILAQVSCFVREEGVCAPRGRKGFLVVVIVGRR